MKLNTVLTPELVICNCTDSTKKKVLERISKLVSEVDSRVKYQDVLEKLLARERLGSTTMGHGIAIPHARINNLNTALAVLITLEQPIVFGPEDNNHHVDIVFGLLVPEDANQAHLELLAEISEQLHHSEYRDALRQATQHDELYQIAIKSPVSN